MKNLKRFTGPVSPYGITIKAYWNVQYFIELKKLGIFYIEDLDELDLKMYNSILIKKIWYMRLVMMRLYIEQKTITKLININLLRLKVRYYFK